MKHRPSWDDNMSSWASLEFPHIPWNRNVHCPVKNILPLVLFLILMKPFHVLQSYLILWSHLTLDLASCLFSLSFSQYLSTHLSFLPHMPHHPTVLFPISSWKWYLVRNIFHEVPYYVFFCSFLLLSHLYVQISASGKYSQISSDQLLPLKRETDFHTHIIQRTEL